MAAALPCKREFSSIQFFAETRESTRQRIESATKSIHEGHIARKRQNSMVYHNLFVKQFKPREGPKVTLRENRVHRSSHALRLPRETEVVLQN